MADAIRKTALRMQSRTRPGASVQIKVGFECELLAEVDRLLDNGRGRVTYGSRSGLINNLLRIWVRSERDRLARAGKEGETECQSTT